MMLRYLVFLLAAVLVIAAVLCIMHGISGSLDQLNTYLGGSQ